jgi:hypothetical protein
LLVPSGDLPRYVEGAAGPNHYPLCGSLFAFSLDACFYRAKLK